MKDTRATYSDFLNQNPKCGKDLEKSKHGQAIFKLLNEDRNIIAMVYTSKAGGPAIEAVALNVEAYFERHRPSDFDITKGQRRTVVGCMIKSILAPFGYVPLEPKTRRQKELSKTSNARYFSSGTCYEFKSGKGVTMKVVSKVEPIVTKGGMEDYML